MEREDENGNAGRNSQEGSKREMEIDMSAKQKLLDALFENKEREHVNLKFFRGTASDVSEEDLCEQSASAIFQVDSGLVDRREKFGDADAKQTEVAKIIAAA